MAIKSWASKETQALFEGESPSILPRALLRKATAKLLMVHAATALQDLYAPPSNRLEKLKGDRKDRYSIRINRQYRICFAWRDGHAYEVEIVDYH